MAQMHKFIIFTVYLVMLAEVLYIVRRLRMIVHISSYIFSSLRELVLQGWAALRMSLCLFTLWRDKETHLPSETILALIIFF